MSGQVHQVNARLPDSEPADLPKIHGRWLSLARIAWVIIAIVALLFLITSLPGYIFNLNTNFGHVAGVNRAPTAEIFSVLSAIVSLASAFLSLILSSLLFRRRFNEPAAFALSFYLLIYAVVMSGPLEIWSYYWLEDSNIPLIAQTVLLATPTIALLLLFPNGRFVPPWTRWVLVLAVPWNILLLFFLMNRPSILTETDPIQLTFLSIFYLSFVLIGFIAQIYRYRRISTTIEKQQTKWVIFGFMIWMGYILISSLPYFYLIDLPPGSPEPWWAPAAGFGWFLSLNIVPVTLTIALTRYQLWDIDFVINKALLVGGLSLSIVILYVLIVGAAGLLFQTQSNWLVALAATGLVAVLFNPIRQRMQHWVNRLVYGQRDEPLTVLNRLGQQLEGTVTPALVYPTIVETVAQTLKLPYVEIAVAQGEKFETVESYGKPISELEIYPLTHQGEPVGQLRVAQRSVNEAFSKADQRLLRSIASQSGAAVHAARLTTALQDSRRDLVTAREEERRRLRRDLHDGLGPQLASQTLGLDAAIKLIDNDPEAAKELLSALRSQSQVGVQDVRRLVYGLRPPALDDLGLLGALQESFQTYKKQGLDISFHVDDDLPILPAAVEVASYRIIQEAVTNVIRHAQATSCEVRLENNGPWLAISIQDDGKGLPEIYQPGVGLQSIRERSEELNGRMKVRSIANKGTNILVKIPL